MNLFRKLFGSILQNSPSDPEHAVIVHFQYGKADIQPILDLGDALGQAILKAGVGEYDGNEIAADGSDGSLYMYGPDADRLFETVLPVLQSVDFMKNATVRIRYGPPADGIEEKLMTI